jgi:hypothetical protein
VYVFLVYFRLLSSRCRAYLKDQGVPQGSVLGPLLFSIFMNDLCDAVNHSNCLLFADDLKVYRVINSSSDCFLLQSDIDYVHTWCSANFMKLNFTKIRVISFTRKTNI